MAHVDSPRKIFQLRSVVSTTFYAFVASSLFFAVLASGQEPWCRRLVRVPNRVQMGIHGQGTASLQCIGRSEPNRSYDGRTSRVVYMSAQLILQRKATSRDSIQVLPMPLVQNSFEARLTEFQRGWYEFLRSGSWNSFSHCANLISHGPPASLLPLVVIPRTEYDEGLRIRNPGSNPSIVVRLPDGTLEILRPNGEFGYSPPFDVPPSPILATYSVEGDRNQAAQSGQTGEFRINYVMHPAGEVTRILEEACDSLLNHSCNLRWFNNDRNRNSDSWYELIQVNISTGILSHESDRGNCEWSGFIGSGHFVGDCGQILQRFGYQIDPEVSGLPPTIRPAPAQHRTPEVECLNQFEARLHGNDSTQIPPETTTRCHNLFAQAAAVSAIDARNPTERIRDTLRAFVGSGTSGASDGTEAAVVAEAQRLCGSERVRRILSSYNLDASSRFQGPSGETLSENWDARNPQAYLGEAGRVFLANARSYCAEAGVAISAQAATAQPQANAAIPANLASAPGTRDCNYPWEVESHRLTNSRIAMPQEDPDGLHGMTREGLCRAVAQWRDDYATRCQSNRAMAGPIPYEAAPPNVINARTIACECERRDRHGGYTGPFDGHHYGGSVGRGPQQDCRRYLRRAAGSR